MIRYGLVLLMLLLLLGLLMLPLGLLMLPLFGLLVLLLGLLMLLLGLLMLLLGLLMLLLGLLMMLLMLMLSLMLLLMLLMLLLGLLPMRPMLLLMLLLLRLLRRLLRLLLLLCVKSKSLGWSACSRRGCEMRCETGAAAERAVIAAAIMCPSKAAEAMVSPGDFADPSHSAIWAAIEDLIRAGKPVDLVSVTNRLGHDRYLGIVTQLIDAVPTAENISYHGMAVRQAAVDREVRTALGAALGDKETHGEDLLTSVQASLGRVKLPRRRIGRLLSEGLGETLDSIERLAESGKELSGVPTGLTVVDEHLGGLQFGLETVLAARPSLGKSAMAMNICEYASRVGYVVDLVSIEDVERSVHLRMLARKAQVNLNHLTVPQRLREGEAAKVIIAAGELVKSSGNFLICDDMPRSPDHLVNMMRHNASRRGTQLIVIDFFQKIPYVSKESRNDTLSRFTNSVCQLAKETNAAVLMLAQIRRLRDGAEPQLEDLKDCGTLEQDAYAVMMLTDPDLYDGDSKLPVRNCHIRKNKNGSTGTAPLEWHGKHVTFSNVSPELRASWRQLTKAKRDKANEEKTKRRKDFWER
jgi:replicative DNA helicase